MKRTSKLLSSLVLLAAVVMAIVVMAIVRSSSTQQAFAPAAVVTSVPQTIGAPQLVTSTPEQTTTSPDETALPTLTTDPLHPPQTVSPDQLTVAVGLMHDLDFSKAAVVYCCETSASDESLSVDESLSHTVELSGQLIVLPPNLTIASFGGTVTCVIGTRCFNGLKYSIRSTTSNSNLFIDFDENYAMHTELGEEHIFDNLIPLLKQNIGQADARCNDCVSLLQMMDQQA